MRAFGQVIALAALVSAAPQVLAEDKEAVLLTETDRLMLAQAKSACASQEFKEFFEAFVRSEKVRDAYTAAAVTVSLDGATREIPRATYSGFPVALIDYYWVSANSAAAVLADPKAELEHLKMEWNQSQTNIWRIDWVRVRYDGKSEGGDDLGKETGTYGQPGYVLFSPTATCWELAQDIVGGPGAGLSEP